MTGDGSGPSRGDVLQVSKRYHPEVGGIERVVRSLAVGFSERQWGVRVLASQGRARERREEIDGIEVTRPASLGSLASVDVAPGILRWFRRLAADADIVHLHLPNPLAVVAALAVPTDAAVVATYHADIVGRGSLSRLYRPLRRRFLRRADEIVASSARLADHADGLAPHRGDVTVVPLGVDPDPSPAPADADPAPFEDYVLFVGRLSHYKGVEDLLEAMVGLDAPLVVVGDGDRRGRLERRAAALGIADRVAFLGRVSDARLERCYEDAALLALPSTSRAEAFGLVQLEAMARGTPVVNTDLPTGVPWVSPHGETGLTVPPGDVAGLSDAIGRLLADGELRARYGRAARERVASRFSVEAMVEGYGSVYRRALDP